MGDLVPFVATEVREAGNLSRDEPSREANHINGAKVESNRITGNGSRESDNFREERLY